MTLWRKAQCPDLDKPGTEEAVGQLYGTLMERTVQPTCRQALAWPSMEITAAGLSE